MFPALTDTPALTAVSHKVKIGHVLQEDAWVTFTSVAIVSSPFSTVKSAPSGHAFS